MHRAEAISKEFRDDVVRVACSREPGQHLKRIAADFRISESCLTGNKPGTTAGENAESRELKKLIQLLEQENEGLAPGGGVPVSAQANLPEK